MFKFFKKKVKPEESIAVGDVVMSLLCEGCMASDYRFEYIGRVDGFDDSRYVGLSVRVQPVKTQEKDFRDIEIPFTYEGINSLQKMGQNLWIIFR